MSFIVYECFAPLNEAGQYGMGVVLFTDHFFHFYLWWRKKGSGGSHRMFGSIDSQILGVVYRCRHLQRPF